MAKTPASKPAPVDPAIGRYNKLRALLPLAKELHEKLGAVLEEMDAIAGGAASIGERVRKVMAEFDRAWGARYAGGQINRYVWTFAKDSAAIKALLKTVGDAELVARIPRYLADAGEFPMKTKHSFACFRATVNNYAVMQGGGIFELEGDAGVPDCQHSPPCQTDSEHTTRKLREMREVQA